jgi:hypothetical protein
MLKDRMKMAQSTDRFMKYPRWNFRRRHHSVCKDGLPVPLVPLRSTPAVRLTRWDA